MNADSYSQSRLQQVWRNQTKISGAFKECDQFRNSILPGEWEKQKQQNFQVRYKTAEIYRSKVMEMTTLQKISCKITLAYMTLWRDKNRLFMLHLWWLIVQESNRNYYLIGIIFSDRHTIENIVVEYKFTDRIVYVSYV